MSKPIVTLPQGKLRGRTQKNQAGEKFHSFYGIPYAKAPTAIRRFKAPEEATGWEGIRDARNEGPACPQRYLGINFYLGKEDNCLNLNVFTKQVGSESTSTRPVMVWIHGGGFVCGSNSPSMYGPQYLMLEDIVLVTINYRLGILGFLSVDSDDVDIPGNAGLKDQVMALRWVQKNISAFGGDPNNVTVFGESAGSTSVHYLMLSPLTKGLFHRVIMQSGSALNCWAQGSKGTEEICRMLRYKHSNSVETVKYLRTISAKKLVTASSKSRDVFLPRERRFYGPVIERPSEEAFITDSPENIIKSGNYNKVPMIIGYNSREGFLFEMFRKLIPHVELPTDLLSEVDHQHNLIDDLNKRAEIVNKIKQFYYNGEDVSEENIDKTILLKSDTLFIHKIHRTIILHQNQETDPQPIYVYRMNLDTSLNLFKKLAVTNSWKSFVLTLMLRNKMKKGWLRSPVDKLYSKLGDSTLEGTAHADDLLYLFKMITSPKLVTNSVEEIAMRRFVTMWTNFAKYGEPTPVSTSNISCDILPIRWPPVDGEANYLDLSEQLSLIDNPDLDRMTFWDNLYQEYTVA